MKRRPHVQESGSTAREIAIANRHPRLRIDRRAITRAIELLDRDFVGAAKKANGSQTRLRCPDGELSLVFVTDAELADLHAQFLDDPSITDVITFEGSRVLNTAGEICVSADAASRHVLAAPGKRRPTRKTSDAVDAFSAELTLYLVHGWLHLAGYDDLQPAKKRIMRRAEGRAMRLLQLSDCIPAFSLP